MKKTILIALLFAIALCSGPACMADSDDAAAPSPWRLLDAAVKQAKLNLNGLQKFYNKAETVARATGRSPLQQSLADVDKETERQYEACIATMTLTSVAANATLPECNDDCAADHLTDYFACTSIARGEDACAAVSSLMPSPQNANADDCIIKTSNMRLLKETLSKEHPSMAACMPLYRAFLHNEEGARLACQVFVETPSEAACEKIVPILQGYNRSRPFKVDLDKCRRESRLFLGTQDCSALGPDEIKDDHASLSKCRSTTAFRKAFQAHSPSVCGTSGLCRVMMTGDIKSCNVYVDDFRKKICDEKRALHQKADTIKTAQIKITIKEGGGVVLLTDEQIHSLLPDIQDALAQGQASGGAQAAPLAELSKLSQGEKPKNATLRGIILDIARIKQAGAKAQIDQAQGLLDGVLPKSGSDYEDRKAAVTELREKFQGMTAPDLSDVK